MAGDIISDAQIKRIEEFLSSVEIRFSKTSDGTFTASTSVEPLFCFSRKTPEELLRVVVDTFASYVANFWEGGAVDVTIENLSIAPEPAARPTPPPIPIHALVPYSRARAAIKRSGARALESA